MAPISNDELIREVRHELSETRDCLNKLVNTVSTSEERTKAIFSKAHANAAMLSVHQARLDEIDLRHAKTDGSRATARAFFAVVMASIGAVLVKVIDKVWR